MAIVVQKPDGSTVIMEPCDGTCKEAILIQGLHTGLEDIRITCEGKEVCNEPIRDYDNRELNIRIRIFASPDKSDNFKPDNLKETRFMLRQDRINSLEKETTHVTKQNEFKEVLQHNQEEISEKVRGYFERKISIIERFRPTEFQAVINDGKLRKAKTELEFDHNLLKLAIRFKLEAIEERYQTWLRVIKVNYREQFYSFVTNKVSLLQQTVFEREQEFFSLMRRRYQLIEENKDMIGMTEVYRQKIEREQERYFEWLEYLMEDFQNIVREKIRSYEG